MKSKFIRRKPRSSSGVRQMESTGHLIEPPKEFCNEQAAVTGEAVVTAAAAQDSNTTDTSVDITAEMKNKKGNVKLV